ncbi:hypothetical protein [Haloplanus salinarum]|uniref:hypothetical protein n=1 Tax=Haloplanus salinarum TaxID=1912324 RepID=UPI00214CEC79|nr:hypothetical protein [Haloplanus salinarum]
MDEERLDAALADAFDAGAGERRAVVRAARDLTDAGRLTTDRGTAPDAETVVAELADAPDGASLAERWNWWVGALDVAYGGYAEFRINRYEGNDRRG